MPEETEHTVPSGSAPVAGIDLGGTNMQIGVVRFTPGDASPYRIIGREKRKTKAESGLDAIVDRMVRAVEAACADARITVADLAAIGIGAPGAADPETGVVLEAPNLRWTDIPLARILADRFGRPVVLENDVNAAIVGEARFGAARGCSEVLGAWLGTGVGGGLLLGGKLRHGYFHTAGELGHMHAMPLNPPGSRSLEHVCSRTAVVERLSRLIRANRPSRVPELVGGDLSKIKSSVLAQAYREGDLLTVEVVDHAAELLGAHLGSIHTLLSLQRIVLGGGLTEALGEPFVELVAKHVRRVAFPERAKAVEVVATALDDDAGLLGAAALALDAAT